MEQTTDLISQYKDLFIAKQTSAAKTNSVLSGIHEAGLNEFTRLGFPDKKNEKYKYANLAPVFDAALKKQDSGSEKLISPVLKNAYTIILENGKFLSSDIKDKVIVSSISQAAEQNHELVLQHLSKYSANEDGLVALNTMFFNDGLFLHIPKSVTLKKPVQIINTHFNTLSQTRNLMIVDENCQADIYFFDLSENNENSLSHSVTEIVVGAESRINISRIQKFEEAHQAVTHTFINQHQHSVVKTLQVSLDGLLIRNNLNVELKGQGCEHKHQNLFIADKSHNTDNYTFINHAVPNCSSDQLIKGILKDKATGVFNGKILVSKDAQKTYAYQKNNNLILDPEAKMNTRPQLEIYADDVKCSHGATVGQLNTEALFYMRARGIGEKAARLLLIQGFANEIIESIVNEECREIVRDWVMKKLEF